MAHVLHENRGHPRASRTHLLRPRGPRTDETMDARRPEHRQCDARPRASRNRMERNAQGGEEDHEIHDPGGLVPAAVAAWPPGRWKGDARTDDVHPCPERGRHGSPLRRANVGKGPVPAHERHDEPHDGRRRPRYLGPPPRASRTRPIEFTSRARRAAPCRSRVGSPSRSDGPCSLGAATTSSHRDGRGTCARSSRSEEHTSELQSPFLISYAVFCLKKKKT